MDSYFTYNFTDSSANQIGAGNNGYWYNTTASSYSLGLAELKATATQGAGSAHLVLAYGLENAGLGIGTGTSGFDVLQAYVSYNPGQWTFNLGRFVTWMGYEVIESNSNWNYSHSLLFGAIPFWHTGLSVNYAPSSTFGITGYVTDGNGTTGALATNSFAKTGGLEVTIAPSSTFNIVLNGIMGPQTTSNLATYAAEGIFVFKPDATWSFALDAQYGANDTGVATPLASLSYWGVALYGRYQVASDWAVALRLEDMNDSDNSLGLYGNADGLSNAKAYVANEGTLTVEHNFTANLLGRLEGRLDMASFNGAADKPFPGATTPSSSQFTTTASAVFSF